MKRLLAFLLTLGLMAGTLAPASAEEMCIRDRCCAAERRPICPGSI